MLIAPNGFTGQKVKVRGLGVMPLSTQAISPSRQIFTYLPIHGAFALFQAPISHVEVEIDGCGGDTPSPHVLYLEHTNRADLAPSRVALADTVTHAFAFLA